MTIEFHKRRATISKLRKDWMDTLKRQKVSKTDMSWHKKHLKIVKVRVVDSRKFSGVGGRKIGGKGRIRKGEIGYVFDFEDLEKVGLERMRRC